MTQRMILTRGLPGSGKSTWAKKFVTEHHEPKFRRINRDDVRRMLGKYDEFTSAREALVTEICLRIAGCILVGGENIVIDDCNLNPAYVTNWQKFAEDQAHAFQIDPIRFEIKDFTDVPLRECLKRNAGRTGEERVDNKIIHEMYRKWLVPTAPPLVEGAPDAIIVDMDGTLAIIGNRSPYDASKADELDTLNKAVAVMVESWAAIHFTRTVIVLSGREEKHRDATMRFLRKHKVAFDYLFMRRTGDHRKDFIVKEEIYRAEIAGSYNIAFCLDDRDQIVDLWRRLGLTCFQVGEGWF